MLCCAVLFCVLFCCVFPKPPALGSRFTRDSPTLPCVGINCPRTRCTGPDQVLCWQVEPPFFVVSRGTEHRVGFLSPRYVFYAPVKWGSAGFSRGRVFGPLRAARRPLRRRPAGPWELGNPRVLCLHPTQRNAWRHPSNCRFKTFIPSYFARFS